jgi:hypothetical protein
MAATFLGDDVATVERYYTISEATRFRATVQPVNPILV